MGVLDHLCRYCSKELERSASKDIFHPENSHLLKITFLCLPEKLQANERYPKMACLDCLFKIRVVNEFQDMGLSAFKVFDDILSREDNKASEAQENRSVEIKVEILSDLEFDDEDVKDFVTVEPHDRSLNTGEDNSCTDELPPLIQNPEQCFATCTQVLLGPRSYECWECKKSYTRKSSFTKHMETHQTQYPCKHCKENFTGKTSLKLHQRQCLLRVKLYRCQFCDESFTEKLITRHERMHVETLFQCEHCTKAFDHKSSLVTHMRLHNGDQPFESPPKVRSVPEATAEDLLPAKSAKKYMEYYKMYKDWEIAKRIFFPSENALLAYFGHLIDTKRLKSSTLLAIYSMLKTTLLNKEKVDISQFQRLRALLKKQNFGYSPKKSKVLSSSEIWKFIKEAPDDVHLLSKAIAAFGVTGGLRKSEIHQITLEDVEEKEGALFVTIPGAEGNKPKTFTLKNELFNIYKKYRQLRRANVKTRKLFLNYQKGKCTSQAVGINKIGGIPKAIAQYLKLPDAYLYTGHCFRRSAAHFSWKDELNEVI